MGRRGRAQLTPGMTGAGSIPDVGTDNLMGGKRKLGPVGKIGKKGYATSKVPPSAKKHVSK